MCPRIAIFPLILCSITSVGTVSAQLPPPSSSAESALEAPVETPDKRQCYAEYEGAQVARQAGRFRDARASLLVCSNTACPPAVQTDCVTWLDQVSKSLPTVVFIARVHDRDELGVRVIMDGQQLIASLDGKSVPVDPGPHTFRFERPPYPPVEQQVLISEGEKGRQIRANFAEVAERTTAVTDPGSGVTPLATPEAYRPIPAATFVFSGLTLAGIGGFAFLGASAKSDRDKLLNTCAPFCEESEVNPIKRKLLAADLSLGAAAVSALVATWTYLARPAVTERASAQQRDTRQTRTSMRWSFAPVSGGAALIYREVF